MLNIIRAFCEERDFHIYYIRSWEHDDTCYDVGSHTEFFRVRPAIGIFQDKK